METICLRGATWRLFPCVPWTGAQAAGYGKIYVKGSYAEGRARYRGAHVDTLMRKLNRPLRSGFEACHHCDVKLCVQPEHLYEGTRSENVRDAIERGLWTPSRPKLTEEQKVYVRAKAGQVPQRVLARELNVSQMTISNVIRRVYG
jgi:hypothetical protein